jgi:hypothetical protein
LGKLESKKKVTTRKVEIDLVGETVLSDWYRGEVSGAAMGRRVAYRHIRDAELVAGYNSMPINQRPLARPQYLLDTTPATPAVFAELRLCTQDVSVITRMRCHMFSCIRTHCGHAAHTLHGRRHAPAPHWHHRICTFCLLAHADDNAHFLLHCPYHVTERVALIHHINQILHQAGSLLTWTELLQREAQLVHLLLGVPTRRVFETNKPLHTQLLRAAVKYILRASKHRHAARW